MTPHFTTIVRKFGDDEHTFAFPIGAIRELEDKRKINVPEIHLRMSMLRCYFDDVRETIRIALIYGRGVTPVQALHLVERYCDNRPLEESVGLAVEILGKALYRPDEDFAQKKRENESRDPASEPISGSFTETVQ